MGIKNALNALFDKSIPHPAESLTTPSLMSNRILVLAGFAAFMLFARAILSDAMVYSVAGLTAVYLTSATLVRLKTTDWNGRIRLRYLELAYSDGKVDTEELSLIRKSATDA